MPLKRSRFRNTAKSQAKRARMAELARAVFERDGYKCQWPGGCQTGDTRLDPHHIAERSQRPDLKLEPSNLITICRTHHDWIPLHRQEAIQIGLLSEETYEMAMKAGRASFEAER